MQKKDIETKENNYEKYLAKQNEAKNMPTVLKILQTVKEELLPHNSPPSAYRVYVFKLINSGMPIFDDSVIDHDIFKLMVDFNIIKEVGTTLHQGEKSIKYTFADIKYPKKVLYDHKSILVW